MRKLPTTAGAIILPLILTLFMTSLVSLISTVMALGFGPAMGWTWIKAWMSSWAVAFPAMLVMLPLAKRLAGAVVEAPRP
jgi:Protein of unknown function (DUF2798)